MAVRTAFITPRVVLPGSVPAPPVPGTTAPGEWIDEPFIGSRDGANVDFYTTYVPVVPFFGIQNTRVLSPSIPNYYLAPGTNHVIMVVPPQEGDDLRAVYRVGLPGPSKPPFDTPPVVPPATTVPVIRGSNITAADSASSLTV